MKLLSKVITMYNNVCYININDVISVTVHKDTVELFMPHGHSKITFLKINNDDFCKSLHAMGIDNI